MKQSTVRDALNAAAAVVRADETLGNVQRTPAGSKAYVHNMPWIEFLKILGSKWAVDNPTVTD